jgi:hypothetical protein
MLLREDQRSRVRLGAVFNPGWDTDEKTQAEDTEEEGREEETALSAEYAGGKPGSRTDGEGLEAETPATGTEENGRDQEDRRSFPGAICGQSGTVSERVEDGVEEGQMAHPKGTAGLHRRCDRLDSFCRIFPRTG